MRRFRRRYLSVGSAVGVLLGVGLGVAPVMAAQTVQGAGRGHISTKALPLGSASVAGSYTEFDSSGYQAPLTISADGTFTAVYGAGFNVDKGYWVQFGASMAMTVTSSTAGGQDDGCLLLGKRQLNGNLNSAGKPGPDICNGYIGTWYAIKS